MANPTLVGTPGETSTSGTEIITLSYTVPLGANCIVVTGSQRMSGTGAIATASATYNGAAINDVVVSRGNAASNALGCQEIFLAAEMNPTADGSAHDLVVTFADTSVRNIISISAFQDVDSLGDSDTDIYEDGDSGDNLAEVTLTTAAGDLVVGGFATAGADATAFTKQQVDTVVTWDDNQDGTSEACGFTLAASGATTTVGFTGAAGNLQGGVIAAVVLKTAGGGGGGFQPAWARNSNVVMMPGGRVL